MRGNGERTRKEDGWEGLMPVEEEEEGRWW